MVSLSRGERSHLEATASAVETAGFEGLFVMVFAREMADYEVVCQPETAMKIGHLRRSS